MHIDRLVYVHKDAGILLVSTAVKPVYDGHPTTYNAVKFNEPKSF